MDYAFKIEGNKKIDLKDYDPRFSANLKKADGKESFKKFNLELDTLQELLYASAHNGVLIILQGMDTSGKDGTVSHVMASVNPQGCRVISFKSPTPEESLHDFLWRIHPHTPAKGMMHIFNRSHYEEVLIVRVHNLQPEKTWRKHYQHINNFEKLLTDTGTIVLKFFLHISKEEQMERLKAREDDPKKRWKIGVGDYHERDYWDDYQEAYTELLNRCSSTEAPWYIVPADRKWFRNLAIAEAISDGLQPYKKEWEKALNKRGEVNYQELLAAREKGLVKT